MHQLVLENHAALVVVDPWWQALAARTLPLLLTQSVPSVASLRVFTVQWAAIRDVRNAVARLKDIRTCHPTTA
jgi:hypothetical protein